MKIPITAIPPTTPPAIGPARLVPFSAGPAVGPESVVVLVGGLVPVLVVARVVEVVEGRVTDVDVIVATALTYTGVLETDCPS